MLDGDEIYLFGFSRGAYTARSLAGFIDRVGILEKKDAFYMLSAFELYERRAPRADFDALLENRSTRRAHIDFIGVWDTVGSIGLPTRFFHTITRHRWDYHDVSLVPAIRHAAHALAIDEKRKPFQPTLWTDKVGQDQTLEQRWFVGVHSNIGGGYQKDGLANHALHWMAGKAGAVGLDLDVAFLKPYRPFWGHELRKSYKGFYRLLGPAPRKIGGAGNSSESIDDSVYYRWCNPDGVLEREGEPHPYRPPGLASYFRENSVDPERELLRIRGAKPSPNHPVTPPSVSPDAS